MRLPCQLVLTSFLLLGMGAPAWAAPAQYTLDPVHTRVQFAIDHAGFSKAIGTVSGSTGTIVFDPDDWSTARVEVSIPIARIDLGDAKWNQATLARNLLDGERHPVATFVSTRIEPIDAQRALVHGDLTLRGETREVALQVVLNGLKRYPLPPFRRTVGFSATAALSRAAFGIDAWSSVIGDAVELRLEVEATRSRGAADTGDEPDAADDVPDAEVPAPDTPVEGTPATPPTEPTP
ncbi:YceI family protein [Luteimonas terrae]|uniref:Polyisoprenoid-binding protein YceI n=1 Tax=Luteimonas terrae TaxID=1530191 RepID=A0ABU1XS75_9GAMM|nr:YceI family protein [Luteimonas terrae]MDR7191597.1 polyisoprenoid-binding protein YceI [Luteimonas terrae]